MPGADNRGLDALRVYHESFFADFSAFSNIQIEIMQQVAEGDRVVEPVPQGSRQNNTLERTCGVFSSIVRVELSPLTCAVMRLRFRDRAILEACLTVFKAK